jgi:hypothetical protein
LQEEKITPGQISGKKKKKKERKEKKKEKEKEKKREKNKYIGDSMVLTNIPQIMENLPCMDRRRQSSTNQADHAAEPYLARLHD